MSFGEHMSSFLCCCAHHTVFIGELLDQRIYQVYQKLPKSFQNECMNLHHCLECVGILVSPYLLLRFFSLFKLYAYRYILFGFKSISERIGKIEHIFICLVNLVKWVDILFCEVVNLSLRFIFLQVTWLICSSLHIPNATPLLITGTKHIFSHYVTCILMILMEIFNEKKSFVLK